MRVAPTVLIFALAFSAFAGVEEPNKLDIISINKERTEVTLSLIQQLSWNRKTLSMLETKLGKYVSYIERGQLQNQVPESKGMLVAIHISYFDEPDGVATEQLTSIRETLARRKIKLSWSKFAKPG